MGAVLADVQAVDDVLREGVVVGLGGHVVVEGGVSDDDVADLREHLAADLDNVGLGVVVERGERGDLTDPGEGLVGDNLGLGEVPTALNDAVADAVDGLVNALEDLEDVLDGRLVIRQGNVELLLAAAHLGVADEGAIDADALAVALGVDLASVDVEQLVLERGAACVDDENVHVRSFPMTKRPLAPCLCAMQVARADFQLDYYNASCAHATRNP